ncbi:P1 family peptidase [Sphingomonas sp. ID0503]|uniref:DmpA family aminopeptidase n=1 Tax=Sphingomonas sp. ID0503 TaxID=3399691 RepID=UPI003AFAE800
MIALLAALLQAAAPAPPAGPVITVTAQPQPPAPPRPRAREIGIPFEGTPGLNNAITDVGGVEVGQVTLVSGEGPLVVGQGPIRTGVTVVFPRGKVNQQPVYGGQFDLNGNGEMTGSAYLADFGIISGPIGITNTNAVGQVYAGIQEWTQLQTGTAAWPVVAETWDGDLNDMAGFHVNSDTAMVAIDLAKGGPVEEGNVGGGTGMQCFGFKGGIGTSSRRVTVDGRSYTVGVLVQCNTGDRDVLRIAGVPVGRALGQRWLPCYDLKLSPPDKMPKCEADGSAGTKPRDSGSIIIVVATDAPLMPVQLDRVAKRAAMGLARLGSYAGSGSGDLIVAFTTTPAKVNHPEARTPDPVASLANFTIDPLFQGTVEATEEAVVNALIAAQTMTGANGYTVYGLPQDPLRTILKRYNRLEGRR